jgi:hypothetical protein
MNYIEKKRKKSEVTQSYVETDQLAPLNETVICLNVNCMIVSYKREESKQRTLILII